MLKVLLILFLICLLISYLGYRVLRFFSRMVRVVSGIHEEGQARGPIGNNGPAAGPWRSAEEFQDAYGPRGYRTRRAGGEKDITDRARVVSPEDRDDSGGSQFDRS